MTAAEIFDRGYRHYDGERHGTAGSMKSVARHAARSVLGIGRPGRFKILPILIIAAAYVPSIIYLGLSIWLPDEFADSIVPRYSDAIFAVLPQLIVFSAFLVPGVLVRDRRDGMLALYLSTPLSRWTYIAAKTLAVFALMLIVTLGPALLQFLGATVQGNGPDGFGSWIATAGRIGLSGAVVAVMLGSIALAVSSIATRPAFASVGTIVVLSGITALGVALGENGFSDYWFGIAILTIAADVVYVIFGETPEVDNPAWFIVCATLAWIAVSWAVIWYRYRRVEATK